jgi:hypothetical protein
VLEEAHSTRYLLIYDWVGERWRRVFELGSREDSRLVGINARHAPIVQVYYSLMDWGDKLAVIESGEELWVVFYQRGGRWHRIAEYMLPPPSALI